MISAQQCVLPGPVTATYVIANETYRIVGC